MKSMSPGVEKCQEKRKKKERQDSAGGLVGGASLGGGVGKVRANEGVEGRGKSCGWAACTGAWSLTAARGGLTSSTCQFHSVNIPTVAYISPPYPVSLLDCTLSESYKCWLFGVERGGEGWQGPSLV